MLDDDTIGFGAKKPVRLFNQRLGVDYPGVFQALLKGTAAYFMGNALGAVNAAIDGVASFRIERDLPPPVLAWHLIRIALARAMAELTIEALKSLDQDPDDPAGMVARLDGALEDAEIWIDRDFFARPGELRIIEVVRGPIGEWLAGFGLNQARVASVSRRLPTYFTFALHREWAADPSRYAPIEAELKKAETPFARADARERAWLKNAAYLRRLIQEPAFPEETFGLEQVYVPLRACYRERHGFRSMRYGGTGIAAEKEKQRTIVVDLAKCLTSWLEAWDPEDAVRMICGGPGSGKTSFTKIWAGGLAEQGHRVLFVPLHRLDFQGDLQRALAGFLADCNILPHDPLDAREGEQRLLILFDGLDELAMQGRAGQEVAREFVDAVCKRIERVNSHQKRCVKVVLGGRDVVVQAAERPFEDRQILHVLPYHDTDVAVFDDTQQLLTNPDYACDRWWQQFGAATGEGYERLPEPLAGKDLAEITGQPLLNYLLALSYRQGRRDFSNLNLVYQDLLDRVYERKWGSGKHPTAKVLRREDFCRLLEELALAAWHSTGAARTITETEVERACEAAEITAELATFKEGARRGAVSLLATFYFRQAGSIQGERTFEFTHRSFAEYLTARRIVRWVTNIHTMRRLRDSNRDLGWDESDALLKWIAVTGPSELDESISGFLVREVGLHDRITVTGWRDVLATLISDELQRGLPMHKLQHRFREMVQQARNAEEGLLAAVHACAARINDSTRPEGADLTEIVWPNDVAFRDLLMRLEQGHYYGSLHREYLAWMAASEQNLAYIGLGYSSLREADFSSCHLCRTDFECANLQFCNLAGAFLYGATFELTDLKGANLSDTILVEANLYRATLEDATLRGTDLRGANLAGVRHLDQARNLDQVRSWRGARIERKWVERLQLDAETLGLVVVDDLPDEDDREAPDDMPDHADP